MREESKMARWRINGHMIIKRQVLLLSSGATSFSFYLFQIVETRWWHFHTRKVSRPFRAEQPKRHKFFNSVGADTITSQWGTDKVHPHPLLYSKVSLNAIKKRKRHGVQQHSAILLKFFFSFLNNSLIQPDLISTTRSAMRGNFFSIWRCRVCVCVSILVECVCVAQF